MNAPDAHIRARFSAAAHSYEDHAHVQEQVAQGVDTLCATLPCPESLLDIGCGTGVLTRLVAARYPESRLTALDLSPSMVQRARASLPDEERLSWLSGSVLDLPPTPAYDLAVSSSALHWIADVDALAGLLHAILHPGGYLAAAVMLKGTLRELMEARQAVTPDIMPPGALPDSAAFLHPLEDRGWSLDHVSSRTYTGHYASATDFLRALHRQGLTGGRFARGKRPLTRGELSGLTAYYDRHFSDDQGVFASFEVSFILARRP